tara:strand:+ start:52 stop:504 length:453 start_codon:yes stop_codon:yes gene_type:complete
MKITKRQLKRLIREQVSLMEPEGGGRPTGTWEELESVIDELKQAGKADDVELAIRNGSLIGLVEDEMELIGSDVSRAKKIAERYISWALESKTGPSQVRRGEDFKGHFTKVMTSHVPTDLLPDKYDIGIMISVLRGVSTGTAKPKSANYR